MNTVAIVIGHTQDSPGASSPYGIPAEHTYNLLVADRLRDIADIYCYDTYAYGYNSMVKRNADKINKKDYKLVIELHYNSSVSGDANGCEVLYYFNNVQGKKLATAASSIISKTMGISNRGIKPLSSDKERGFSAVYYPKPTTLLLEPFFGSNKEDTLAFMGDGNIIKYAKAIRDIINIAVTPTIWKIN